MLGEPTNDLDTDMLAAIEDLLDTWPGTLIVVSHDRYLIERVTDQQYAVLGGHLRHLPGGVEEYLRLAARGLETPPLAATLREPQDGARPSDKEPGGRVARAAGVSRPALSGADERAAEKERASVERKLERLAERIAAIHERMVAHDQSDYEGLGRLNDELRDAESETAALEERWLELSELLG